MSKEDNSSKTISSSKKLSLPKISSSSKKEKAKTKEEVFHTIKFVEDVPRYLQAEISRTELSLQSILSWKIGGIVEFPKIVGEPVEVLIGERLIAKGEVVVVNDRYGVRISEITRPDEQMNTRRKG